MTEFDATNYQNTRSRQKFERHMYYRRPKKGEDAGWIVVAGNNANRMNDMMARGFEPLHKYGTIPGNDAGGNVWAHILAHPDGPKEFPAEQVMAFRWYKEPPVPGIKFPQLSGHKIKEYRCPECSERPPFQAVDGMGGIEHLARHLRILHSWPRDALIRYGEAVGIDFNIVYSNIEESYEFDAAEAQPMTCDECDWMPDPAKKSPEAAVRMHKMKAHKPLEVETIG